MQLSREPHGRRRSDMSEPPGITPGPPRTEPMYTSRWARRRAYVEPSPEALRASRWAVCRAHLDPNLSPKRRERAVAQYGGPVSIRTIPPKRYPRAIRASRRASRQAHLDLNHSPKRDERAAGQAARPVSIRAICRSDTSEPLGKLLGSSRTIRRSTASEQSRTRLRNAASEPTGSMPGPSQSERSAEAPQASHLESSAEAIYTSRLTRRRACANPPSPRPMYEPVGDSNTELNPLDYSL